MPVFHEPHFPQPGETPARRRSPPTPSAIEPVPLRTPSSPAPVRAIEPWNPYPPRVRTSGRKAFASSWPEMTLVFLLLLAGLGFVSTIFLQRYAETRARSALTKTLSSYSETATVTFGRLNVSLFKGLLQVHDVNVTLASSGETIHVGRLSLWGLDVSSLKQILLTHQPVLPETSQIAFDGLDVDQTFFGDQAKLVLSAMGYESLQVSGYAVLRFSRVNRTLNVDDLQIAAPQVGRVRASIALGHVTLPTHTELSEIRKDPRKLLEAELSKITIDRFDFKFEDDSLVSRSLQAFKTLPGETSPQTLVDLAIELNGGLGSAPTAANDFVKPALEKARLFLLYPRSLSISAHPSQGVTLLDLFDERTSGSVNDLAHHLNLRVD